MSVIISHPTGNEFFRAAAKSFYDAGELQSIYTCIASFPNTPLYKLGSFSPFHDIRRRSLDTHFKNLTHTRLWKELGRLLSIKTGRKKWLAHETGTFSIDKVYQDFDSYVAKCLPKEKEQGATSMYAYEDGAARSFTMAKKLGMQNVYDLPIGYWRSMHQLLAAEKELHPEWGTTLEGLANSSIKLERKDQEIEMADKIIVASSFTAKSLEIYPKKLPAIYTVPYGFPTTHKKEYRNIGANDTIKLLFVGGLSQRKGLSYLFDAMKGFENKIELTIVGRDNSNKPDILKYHLGKYTWIESLPHARILSLMRVHDILIFPSLFEGFGLVITEAMAQGTPVITTERTGGPDLIQHNENGWIVKAGSVTALQNIISNIIDNTNLIQKNGEKALETARLRPWSVYEKELAAVLD